MHNAPKPAPPVTAFEKLEKVVNDMNRVRVTLERDAFRALTHTDSLQDADVLKKRKNYDESLTHCMLQLDAIEASGEDRERIKSERRVIISSIQKLQACLEEYVEYAHHTTPPRTLPTTTLYQPTGESGRCTHSSRRNGAGETQASLQRRAAGGRGGGVSSVLWCVGANLTFPP